MPARSTARIARRSWPGAARHRRRLAGSVFVEQLVLICAVSLPLALAFIHVGARWLELYLYQRRVLGFPLP